MNSGMVAGAKEMLDRTIQAQKDAHAGAIKGLGQALNLMLQVSNKRVPHEEGDLERDGAVVIDEAELLGAVSYGNNPDTAAYAERQHEDMTLKHDPGRSAKFLEQARNETRDQALAILGHQISSSMGTTTGGGE